MKNLYLLSSFFLFVNLVFAGGGNLGRHTGEIWLLITPVLILSVLLLSTYLNKMIRQKIEERRLRKEEEVLEQNNEQTLNNEFVVI